jgi:Flp pilus assembly protein TadG
MIQRTTRFLRRRAATAVEFAVVAPVFFIFVLGLVELGRGFMVVHQLTNAARQGCRVGVVEGKTYSDIQTVVTNSLTAQGIAGEGITIQVNDVTDTSGTFAANPGDEVTVKVSVTTSSISWVPGAKYMTGGSLTGKFTLRRE